MTFYRSDPASPHRAIALVALTTICVAPCLLFISQRLRAELLSQRALAPQQLTTAANLDPSNDLYLIRLAQRNEELALPSLPVWRRAISLNPRRDLSLTQAAIAAELEGNLPLARQLLTQAETYNQLWLPRWSLANFHARHNQPEQVFHWSRLALQRAYGDRTPLFNLCRQTGASDTFLLESIVSFDRNNLAALLDFFRATASLDALEPASRRYLSAASPSLQSAYAPVAAAIESLLAAHRLQPALALWNTLAGRRFIPYPAWSPTSPLVNPSLELPLSPPAFDWHVPSVEGVDSLRGVPPSGIKFAFSGHQPESAELLYQALFLLGGRAWTLSFEYQTRSIAPAQSGLFWNLSAAGDSPPLHPSEEWSSFSVSWTMPPQDSLRRLALIFRRPPGQVRTDGELYIRGLRLEAARR